MPLSQHEILTDNAEVGIWQIEETEEWFLKRAQFLPSEVEQLARIRGRKRLEWLAVRYLLHHLSGRKIRGALVKDEYGKPHLEGSPFQISISHSHGKAAVIAAPELCGIDIQKIVPKILRIQAKFMNEDELEGLTPGAEIEQSHIVWGAKESLFKAYGRKQVDFRKHLHVLPFDYHEEGGKTTGFVLKDDIRQVYDIHYELIDDFMLVYARHKKTDTTTT